jgi:hypothetical protein
MVGLQVNLFSTASATSCHSMSISISLNAEERASSTSQDRTVTSSQQPAGQGDDHGHDKATGQANGRVVDQHKQPG